MPTTIPVAYDFVCEWSWIGKFQARRLREEFGAEIDWRPYVLFPDGGAEHQPPLSAPSSDRPSTPDRYELALAAEGLEFPSTWPPPISTHNAHTAALVAKPLGLADAVIERIFRAYWKEGLRTDDPEAIVDLTKGLLPDPEALRDAMASGACRGGMVLFDDDAHATGVWNTPTFWIEGRPFAEQPYAVLRRALESSQAARAESPYPSLEFPAASPDRPYAFLNMVCTIDGKSVSGERDEGVVDLGSPLDHAVMRAIEGSAEAVLIGGQTLRATKGLWFPRSLFRIVATRSGDVKFGSRFFSDAPERAFVAGPESLAVDPPAGVRVFRAGRADLDLGALVRYLRSELGIRLLLVEGGSELNAALLAPGLIDEVFLTIAPKVKLGRTIPTLAGGEPLPQGEMQSYTLISSRRIGDEVFLRYRRNRA
jgi:riboflavin biosynthesis pyrimidine reductase/2-hydroxychromene-2-carboxylate isomerase